MVEPIGLTGTIIAILQLTAAVIGYIKDVKGASEHKKKLLVEVRSVEHLLNLLSDQAGEVQEEESTEWSATLKSVNEEDGPLRQIRQILEGLRSKLQPVQGLKKVGKVLLWPFEKKEVDEIVHRIERQKTWLNLALQNDHM
jgi:hypothetical protein